MITKNTKYFQITTDNLKVNTVLDFDIYIKTGNNIVLFRKHHLPFTEDTLNGLTANKVNALFVLEKDVGKLENYFHSLQDNNYSDFQNECFAAPFDNPENVEKYYKIYLNYYPIEKGTMLPGSKVYFNVYKNSDIDVELYFGPDKQENLFGIVPEGVHDVQVAVAIHNDDIPLYKKYINDIAIELKKSNKHSSAFQHSILRENSKFIIKGILDDPRSGETIQKAGDLVETLTDTILSNQNNFASLLKINTHDYYTYTHSLNVCSLSIGLGTELGLRKDPDLFELGLGALLHDIGKCAIEPLILNKPGKLTDEEFIDIQNHVIAAKTILNNNNTKTPHNSLLTILQHHEKLSGKGYPYNLKGGQISIFGRIVAIVDFYDAITTERSYKKAFTPFEAFGLLSNTKEHYDQSLIKKFIIMLGNQAN
jgi:HD-GYP domain-containing protein (c-di-GMP phosphodiesterase class II)